MAFDIPVVIGPAGLQPTPPATLQQEFIAEVTSTTPGYTANLPGSMIEDMTSTGVGGLVVCDQAKVEAVNSLTPAGANVFLLQQLGQMLGVKLGTPTNTSVPLIFSAPSNVGYVIPQGLLVGDGTHVYQVQVGGVIGAGGTSSTITAIAINPGSWSVPVGSVTQIQSSVPSGITLSVTNATAGTPGGTTETFYSYRTRVIQAMLATCVGSPRMIKTLVALVAGVPSNLISVQQATGGLRVCVGGSGDPYQIANAIFMGVGDPTILVGSGVSSSRNQAVSLVDYPDTYTFPYVVSPAQTITLSITWNTILSNFTAGAGFPNLTQGPLANYINGIATGRPINILELNAIFQNAVAGLLDPTLLTKLAINVFINGTLTPPATGTSAVQGDAESYFTCVPSGIAVAQG